MSFSQSVEYKKASTEKGSNYYEIVAKKTIRTQNITLYKIISMSDIKAMNYFERWAYYRRDRVNPDGSFPSALKG